MLSIGLVVSFLVFLAVIGQAQPTNQLRNHQQAKRDYAHSVPSYNPAEPMGIAYSPYQDDGSCKNLDQNAGLSATNIWIVHTAILSIPNNNLRLFLGIFDISDVYGSVQTIIRAVNYDFSKIVTVSVGNELVNNGIKTPTDVINAIGEARNLLRAAGYAGPVVTVDTFVALKAHVELCYASDYVAANIHPFFDGQVYPENSGEWVRNQVNDLAAACNNWNVLVTETGWPTAGNTVGVSVPSIQNQETALRSISRTLNNGFVSFSAFNDLWKAPGPFNCEKSWGLLR
ncbi:Cell surface mannoprotein MP65 [Neolecta irregularis DAH-3]|uniref:Cell surface mannoprotein MP65 n=1 Tax=Neolecta irregularis (strain DAH-3) TaxID=1198029 RepID=A0A1U7LJQ5_NEOID|nr:Cell surface mannoprotein MP65 [Neolecta irregularis DAH-3]|eukprot:OLL22823.1 Cell surface mannoprotein MP65 [Neolecta irregularis DAH-3]